MRMITNISAAALILGGLAIVGCHKSGDSGSDIQPTMTASTDTPAPAVIPTGTPPAAKDLTHVLTKDEPFFLGEPGASDKPVGTLMMGSKVLVLIPGATYSQVITDKGVSAYVPTDGLNPLGK